ncbi:MAG TPA: porphobilinogen synthase, partial [Candidatus Binatia bacterium]|nr:porphobilinogen synthase [Candidatus Binatia bacterium]
MKGHGEFPQVRLRRLRRSPALRALVAETRLSVQQLVLPLFVRPGRKVRLPVRAMPGVSQLSPDEALKEAELASKLGVPAVLLFGIPDKKDAKASGAYAA